MSPRRASASQRVFVALWPADDVRARLAQVVSETTASCPAGRPMQTRNLHLTLAFIGALEVARVNDVADAMASIEFAAFAWQVDRIGAFARARVVWAGGAECGPLDAVAAQVRSTLDRLQVRYDGKPFAAHVTLLRDVAAYAGPTSIQPPIVWSVTRAVLVQSVPGSGGPVYRPLRTV